MDIIITRKRVIRFLIGSLIFVVLAHLIIQGIAFVTGHDVLLGVVPLFNLNAEANVPTFFSALLLFITSLLLFLTAGVYRKLDRQIVKYWIVLGLIFVFLTLDEFASIHERFDGPLRTRLGTEGFLHFAWVIPYAVLVLAIGLYFIKFLMYLDKRVAVGFFVSGTLFVTGALGFEMLGGQEAFRFGQTTLTFILLATVEETLEMSGVLLFIHYILLELSKHIDHIKIDVKG